MSLNKTGKLVAGVVPLLLSACGPLPSDQTQSPVDATAEGSHTGRLYSALDSGAADVGQAYQDRSEVSSYFCDPYYSDPYCGCPYYDPYCEGLPPPPPSPPQAMTYTPFSETSSVQVSWRAAPSGDEYYYELERYTNGAWSNIYTGSQRSASGGISAEGLYAFRVRACNDGGCSQYLTDPEMRFSYGPSRSLNGIRRTEVEEFVHRLGYETPAALGFGYDHLRQELTSNNCLDMAGASTYTTNARTKDFKLSMANSRDELSTSLSLTQNLGVSAKYGKFSASYSGKKELVSTSTRIEETTMVVASLRDQFSVDSLYNPSLMNLSGGSVNMLQTGQSARFRNVCGDGLVHSIAYGRQFYITFQLKSFNYSQDEIRTQTQNMKVDIGSYVSANYDSTKRSQITQKYSGYDVQARVLSYGSSTGVTGVVSLDAALQFMKDFEAEPVSNGSYPIDFKVADYSVPAGVYTYPFYHPYKNTLQRWYSFDQQLARRCEMFDETLYPDPAIFMTDEARQVGVANGSDLREVCFRMKRAVQENIQNCEDTTKWGQCVQPDASNCTVPGSGESCLSYANRIPYWTSTSASLRFDEDIGTGLSSRTESYSATACLFGQQIRDQRIKSVDCNPQDGCPYAREGVTVKTSEVVNARSAWNSYNPSNKCLSAYVTLSRGGWWGGGARIHQQQTISGLNAQSLSYQF
jgi:hypothetical protein